MRCAPRVGRTPADPGSSRRRAAPCAIRANTRKQLREAVADTPWPGLHPHAFRHLTAARLDAAGLSAREIADHLGRERVSMAQDVHVSHNSTGANARPALDALGPPSAGPSVPVGLRGLPTWVFVPPAGLEPAT